MASTNAAAQTPLVVPSDGPHAKFLRYARAVAKEHQQLFPITPATRALVVGLDLRTLGLQPADYEDLVHVLRRDVVTPMLLTFSDDDAGLAEEWMQACEVEERYVIDFTDRASAGRFLDAMEFGVSKMRGEERRGYRNCRTFDVYSEIDAHYAPTTDLTVDDRVRAAVLAATGFGLGTDVIVSLGPTVGRADVGDNDIVTTVTPEDLHPVFGHYLRMTGNRTVAEYRYSATFGNVIEKMEPPSLTKVYDIGLSSLLSWFDAFRMVTGGLIGDAQALAEIDTIQTRIRRAARALDDVIAALSRTNGRDAAPSADTIEFVSEAFDRELLYLMAVFDGYGRAFVRWLDPTTGKDVRKSLHSSKTLDDYVDTNYPGAPQLTRLHELQRFAFTCSQLRNRIHDAVLPTGSFTNRTYGNGQAIAIDLGQTDVELTQELVDRLGVWQGQSPTIFGQPTTVAEIATTAVELFTASLEYVDLFTYLIMCNRPVDAPNAARLLGSVNDTGFRPPQPHPTEALYRQLFRWD
ncbi:hypothetical protein ORI20_20330 [Mycobacterium sp. CVI_P3]|uniref:Uncharacterized protein n=1 Tax=Mycobacterium pinniadriaticum TaxID=2994102 RepID=A0ABT3SHP1_9MYCO|nr:hypothetical protein [Mycobacterium pinniadriaticum]MCX2932623.1 hypothetical protein [Mycobacterium pinniadriaticum]MCX2939047.1 hypothetical protein [Mycobacterium pinniadriaticum]